MFDDGCDGDGDVKTACQTACSTDAIIFGDVNDNNSRVRKHLQVEKIAEN